MKTIRLEPVKFPQPRCSDYRDERVVREFERQVRVQRARVEPFELMPFDARLDGAWRVSGATGSAWHVDIVDGSGTRDTCSCPDFLTNDIGTCKHLEALRRAIDAVKPMRSAYTALGPEPAYPVVTVRVDGGLSLQIAGKWNARLLAVRGLARTGSNGEVHLTAESALRAGWDDRGVRVVHAAVAALERMRTVRALEDRRRSASRAFEGGRLGTDVLAEPLFPYQRDGVVHLAAAGRALLADDMGLGKTVQAIAACEILRRRGEAQRVLVVTPASLKDQWAKEIRRYAGETAIVVGGNPERRRQAFGSDAPYKILNYELTWRELSRLQALDADILVLDEAQRAKNFRTKTANTLRWIPSRFLFVLTGTPIENRLDDLYSLLQLVDPALLGPLWKFNLDFHAQDDKGKITGYRNLSGLRERIAPVVLRRRKEAVLLQLPPLTEQTRYTPLDDEQRGLEEEYRGKAARIMKTAERRALTKEEQEILMMCLIKARQACNAAELCDPKTKNRGSPKLDELEALVGEITSQGSSKILVFSEWVEMLKLAAARLDRMGVGYDMLHGGIPTERRPALLQRFREDADLRVLLCSEAGGVGLNLQVASYVVHLDLPWNPGKLDQRTARAHRLGQTRGVSVTYLCAQEGIERGIEGTLAGKRAVREAALDRSSEVETLEAPSFSVFLRQLREVFERLAKPGEDVRIVDEPEPEAKPAAPDARAPLLEAPPGLLPAATQSSAGEAAAPGGEAAVGAGAAPGPGTAPDATAPSASAVGAQAPSGLATNAPVAARSRARNRLHLAEVVLREGFAADAVRACYDALAAAIRGMAEAQVGASHEGLVAVIYRELLPSGRLPVAAHAALATLRDLSRLDEHGVEVNPEVARQALDDARQWVERLAGEQAEAQSGAA